MKKHPPAAGPKSKRPLRSLGSPAQAGKHPPAAVRTKTEFQRVVHKLQVHQEELEAQNEELRETQHLLEASRDRYADLYDFAPIGYVTLDGTGHIREINLTGATILGRERSRLLGTLFSVSVTRDKLDVFRDHLQQCQQGSGSVTTELTLAARGRDPIWVQLHSVPIRNLAGQTAMYRTAITDITERREAENILRLCHDQLEERVRERTAELAGAAAELRKEISERKEAEESLRESEQAQRALFESAPDPIVVADAEGRIERVNRQAEVMFGYQRSELMDQPVEMLIPELLRGRHERHRAGYIASPYLRPMGIGLQLYGRRKDGSEFPVDIMLSPLTTKRGVMHGKTSPIHHNGKDLFQGMANPFAATRYHSLVIKRETMPDCLEITAQTDEGEIMGVRHKSFPIWGVQFHPESILTENGRQILRNFLAL